MDPPVLEKPELLRFVKKKAQLKVSCAGLELHAVYAAFAMWSSRGKLSCVGALLQAAAAAVARVPDLWHGRLCGPSGRLRGG